MQTDELLSVPKLLLRLLAPRQTQEPALQPTLEPLYLHIARLEHILQKVHKDGFHVEYIRALGWQTAEVEEIIAAVNRWAGQARLKVSINQVQGIFFFEK